MNRRQLSAILADLDDAGEWAKQWAPPTCKHGVKKGCCRVQCEKFDVTVVPYRCNAEKCIGFEKEAA